MMNRRCIIIFSTVIFLLLFSTCVFASHTEVTGDQCFTLIDEENNIVHKTALKVCKGDVYIAADNSKYRVVSVNENTANCVYQGKEDMPKVSEIQTQASIGQQAVPVQNQGKKATIAVYHTHSDESYIPEDGKESIRGDGGIYDVGESLVKKLKEQGFNVEYSENRHDPHDANAYHRSRKTAVSLIKSQPDAIIDVHRDAVPADVYQANVEGEEVTKVKLVIGRQNPNMKTNMEFAKKIKAVMDEKKPGLSNGIYVGKGDYNQELSPHAILIEVGAHTNSKKDAEEGAMLFAETLPTVLGTANNQAEPAKKPISDDEGSGTTILVILVLLGLAGGGYYLLNKGYLQKR